MSLPVDAVPSPPAGAGGDGPGGQDSAVESPRPSRRREIVCALVALAFSLVLLLGAQGIEVRTETGGIDPRWWPRVLGISGTALSLLLLAVAVSRPPMGYDDLSTTTATGRRRLALALLACAGLVLAWPVVGFVPAAALFVAALTFLFGGRGWRTLLLFPALLTAFLHVLFAVLLEVPL